MKINLLLFKSYTLKIFLILFALGLSTNSSLTFEYSIEGKVISVTDGDTFTIKTNQTTHKIRLSQIDTPEKKQPWGRQAKLALSEKIYGKIVKVDVETTDRYGRPVGMVWFAGQNINRSMVREGHAWVYRKYATDNSLFDDESYARNMSLGLWSLPENQRRAPWKWRKEQR